MILGIIGEPGSGKKTLVRLLVGELSKTKPDEPLEVVVDVPDQRIDLITKATKATKKTLYKLKFLLPSLSSEKINMQLNQLRNCDGFLVVLNNFLPSVAEDAAIKTLKEIQGDVILADLLVAEKRLEGLGMDKKKGKPINPKELELLNKAKASLEKGLFLREIPELKDPVELRGFRFLTQRPFLVVFNNAQDQKIPGLGGLKLASDAIGLPLALETELLSLAEEEKREFMELYGMEGSFRDEILKKSFALLGLKTFFTYVSNEVRAWAVPKSASCIDCAGVIHSDIRKGFIRAEVVSYEDLVRLGDIQACKKAGVMRLEGKDYVVKDGDVITFRFNV